MKGIEKHQNDGNFIGLTVTVINPYRDGISFYVYGRVIDQDKEGFSVSVGGMIWNYQSIYIDPDMKLEPWRTEKNTE